MRLIAGTGSEKLASQVAQYLGIDLVSSEIKNFSDGEIFVQIKDNIRGDDIFVMQSTSYPANENLMELLIILDTLKRCSAGSITAIIPYFGYARQDRKVTPRTPITAKLVANLITTAGADRVVTIDLHAAQIQGFFDIPVDNLYASSVFGNVISSMGFDTENTVMVSPDVGGICISRKLAKKFGFEIAIVDKRRERIGVSEVMNIIGDVNGKRCIIVDDIVDTAGTLCNAASELMNRGATSVMAFVTHGVLSGDALHRIRNSNLEVLYITDSICINNHNEEKIKIISVAELLGRTLKNIENNDSVSVLFE